MIKARFFTVCIYLLSLVLLVGCASTKTSTAAIDTSGHNYPRDQFLTAYGQGNTISIAEENARLNLAKIFSVRITSDQLSIKELNASQTHAGEQVAVSSSLISNIRQQTDQLIEGVEVISDHTAKAEYYTALAILERTPAASRLRQQIATLDEQTEELLIAASRGDSLEQLAAHYQAWQSQLLAQNRRNQLAIVTNSAAPQGQWPISTLRTALMNDIRQLKFTTEFTHLESDYTQLIESALSTVGFEQLHSETPEYKLTITTDIHQPFERDKWYWQSAQIKFAIEDIATGRDRGGWLWNFKASATQQSLLNGRMKTAIILKIEKESVMKLIAVAKKYNNEAY